MKTNKIWLILFCLMMLSALSPCAQEHPNFWWSTTDGDTTYNFHPAGVMDRADGVALDSVPLNTAFTVAIVYRTIADTNEQNVWTLGTSDGVVGGLSTHRILGRDSEIQYSDRTQTIPMVNIVSQSLPSGVAHPAQCLLRIGGFDSAECGIKVPEVMYYDRKMPKDEMGRVQSYLAVKYGITLDAADYVDGHGEMLWEYSQQSRYHHRITALGRDSVYGLAQLRSRSEVDGSMLTISADSLSEGTYIIFGDDGGELTFAADSTTELELLGRRWQAVSRMVGGVEQLVTIGLDTRDLPTGVMPTMYVGEEPYHPYRTSDTTLVYDGVTLPQGTSNIFFAIPEEHTMEMAAGPSANDTEEQAIRKGGKMASVEVSTDVYPNPSTGHYNIVVRGTERMHVKIYNTLGVVVREVKESGKAEYRVTGTLPTGSLYYVDVTTDEGTKTIKLVVK